MSMTMYPWNIHEPENFEIENTYADNSINHNICKMSQTYGEGDTYLIENVFDKERADQLFHQLKEEVHWGKMFSHGSEVPRKICIMCDHYGDKKPIYRHPYDEEPENVNWTPGVRSIREHILILTGQNCNHGLVQLYESGFSFIGQHSDKTLDIDPNSVIINFSLGAERTMILKNKLTKEKQKIRLPHNSAFIFGLKTNEKWYHEIKEDRRMDSLKDEKELAFDGQRISITFRKIGTFITNDGKIVGQGAAIDNDERDEKTQKIEMITAFSRENHDHEFDREKYYSRGFDVKNFSGV